jgi:transcriptional regulator with XRE-family HTH domain
VHFCRFDVCGEKGIYTEFGTKIYDQIYSANFFGFLFVLLGSYICYMLDYQAFIHLKKKIMDTFGKKLRDCRDAKNLSQKELAKLLGTSYSVIGKYERDEMLPSIDAAKRIAHLLDTTVGYMLGESDDSAVLKDQLMLKRLNDIDKLPLKDRECILYTLDHLLASVKTELVYR